MTNIPFTKYHGTGNDFILIDDRSEQFNIADFRFIAGMCERHFGIGADGLILLRHHPEADFRMIYFNADGLEGSMCGNGARCAVAFARSLDMCDDYAQFMAFDGAHTATITGDDISVSMSNVTGIEETAYGLFLDTGSPHIVLFVDDLDAVDVLREGRAVRYSPRFMKDGVNVNLVMERADEIHMRTYERGVENETLSCGTGAVAVALAVAHRHGRRGEISTAITTSGGALRVDFVHHEAGRFEGIFLRGMAERVFTGDYHR